MYFLLLEQNITTDSKFYEKLKIIFSINFFCILVRALENIPQKDTSDSEDLSPDQPLPTIQVRDNLLS